MERKHRRTLIGVSVGHAAHDAWYGVAPVLLAALSTQMRMSNSDIGFMLLLYQGISSISQPIFGRASERFGSRRLAVGAIIWTTAMFSIALLAPSKIVIAACIALAGLGSGAWHPQGVANATIAGGKRWGATSASVFFLGGILGTAFLGSALGGYLLEAYGRPSLLVISAITVALALTVVRTTVPERVEIDGRSKEQDETARVSGAARGFWIVLAFLLLGIALRSLANMSLTTYIPKQQQDLGVSPGTYGLVMSFFLFCTAIGGVLGSYLADRVGLRRVLTGSLVMAALMLAAFTRTSGPLSYIFLGASGFFVGPSHTLFVVAGQRQFPRRIAMISGLILGFAFVSGSGGAWLMGLLADRVGLNTVFGILPWAMLGAAIVSFFSVPRKAAFARQAEPSPSPAGK